MTNLLKLRITVGKSETFVIETGRYDELGGDFIFVECIDETGVTRIALPPRVSSVIAGQRDRLTSRRRTLAGKQQAAARKEAGLLPGFMKGGQEGVKKAKAS